MEVQKNVFKHHTIQIHSSIFDRGAFISLTGRKKHERNTKVREKSRI